MKRRTSCKYFLFPALTFLLLSGIFLLVYSRLDIHLFINQKHAPWADTFFKYVTHLGDGWVFALAVLAALFIDLRSFFTIGFSALFVMIFTAITKKWLFQGLPRPSKFYEDMDLYYVPGVKLHSINSFPSGHTMAAFAFYFALCYVINKKYWGVLFALLAILVGYSRTYLSQHFLIDVFAGGMCGIVCAVLGIALANSWKWKKLDFNLIQLKNKNV